MDCRSRLPRSGNTAGQLRFRTVQREFILLEYAMEHNVTVYNDVAREDTPIKMRIVLLRVEYFMQTCIWFVEVRLDVRSSPNAHSFATDAHTRKHSFTELQEEGQTRRQIGPKLVIQDCSNLLRIRLQDHRRFPMECHRASEQPDR